MIRDKQLLLTKIIIETSQEFPQADRAHHAKTCPHNSQHQSINETRLQLFGIQVFAPLDAERGEVSGDSEKHGCISQHSPTELPLGGKGPPSLIYDGFIGLD